jgi:hypothetical protein
MNFLFQTSPTRRARGKRSESQSIMEANFLFERLARFGWRVRETEEGWELEGNGADAVFRTEESLRVWLEKQEKTTDMTLKAPFPYFGGKSRIAGEVWARFGKVENYVEPFFGSGAILLSCPHPGHTETVNDADGLLANFWRATQYAPDAVASYADWPVNEADLHARHRWLVDHRSMVEDLMSDPEWFDAQAAGWWVWGISQWIGTGWCPPTHAGVADRGIHRASDAHALPVQMPSISDGRVGGLNAYAPKLGHKMPFVASPSADRKQHGQGVHGIRLSQQMPNMGGERSPDRGTHVYPPGALYDYFRQLSDRLRRTRVVCGDFARILGASVTWRHGLTAIFLDPPYADDEHAVTYSGGGKVWERVTKWCEENGSHPAMRIALCGYADTWEAPQGWEMIRWRTSGGYGSQGNARGRENANREAIWFSPACLNPSEEAKDTLSRPIVVADSDYAGTLFE